MEKRNYVNKNITKLTNDKNENITDQKQILHEVKDFYQQLYQSKDDILDDINLSNLLDESVVPKLSNDNKVLLDNPITSTEVLQSLKRLKNSKSPGTTGFQADFFQVFLVRFRILYC